MSETTLLQTTEARLLYKMHTTAHLDADECIGYLAAAADEVALGVHIAFIATLRETYEGHVLPLAATRSFNVRIVSISYRNPWEIIFEAIGAAAAIVAAVETIYLLRRNRRKIEAETKKLYAETLESQAREVKTKVETDALRWAHQQALQATGYDYSLEEGKKEARKQLNLELQDRPVSEVLVSLALRHSEVGRAELGLAAIQEDLYSDIWNAIVEMRKREGLPALSSDEVAKQTDAVADNARLMASYMRLDEVERTVEILSETKQNEREA